MATRVGLIQFIDPEQVMTKVFNHRSATIPDQSLSLRDIMAQFAYIGNDKLRDIIERGFDGDEDDPTIMGVDVGALDFAEVHDRMLELEAMRNPVREVAAPAPPVAPATEVEPQPQEKEEKS